MNRKQIKSLTSWIQRQNRKPLILRGARQVGKSTLVRNFAKSQGLDLFEINLERHLNLDKAFATLDLSGIISALETAIKRPLGQKNTILFLDEIQATPHALAALRYFYEDMPQLPVLAAGSLLEFTLADHSFSMPVGRIEYLHMGPLDFEEFLEAKEEQWLLSQLASFQLGQPWAEDHHTHAKRLYREYLFVGGMPEVVATKTAKSSQEQEWVIAQRTIMYTYKDDFVKYAPKGVINEVLQLVFERLPRGIGRKIKYSDILPGERSDRVRKAIELMSAARIIHLARHTHAQGIPLGAEKDYSIAKPYWLDTGLLNRALGLNLEYLEPNTDLINEGVLAEQFVAQHLAYWEQGHSSPELFYWLREGKSTNAEIDFLVQVGPDIIPIEVKSQKSGALKSMQQFAATHNLRLGVKLSMEMPSLVQAKHTVMTSNGKATVDFPLLTLPLYFVTQLPRLIRQTTHLLSSPKTHL